MAILNYISAASTPTSPVLVPDPTRQTKVILPKKKSMKWSTGVASGDYGGSPTTTKLRKYYGGEKEDPVTSDELIWNADFMGRMEKFVRDTTAPTEPPRPKEKPSGFLSINRAMSLDSMEVDLSKELTVPSKRVLQLQVEAARQGRLSAQGSGAAIPKWRLAPTRREQVKWDQATKATIGGTDAMLRETRKPKGDSKVLAAEAREQYFKLKNKLQNCTLAIGGVGIISSYFSYTPEITSFGAGFIGSLIYIRMLGNTVDSMADGVRGVIKGVTGQPRILIPVALVLIYSRWNGIVVPEYGLMHLDLIPMLVGFFTYKIAAFTQAIEEAITIVQSKTED